MSDVEVNSTEEVQTEAGQKNGIIVSALAKRFYSLRKVNRKEEEVEALVANLVQAHEFFSSLGEYEYNVTPWMMRLEDIAVLNELAFLVAPAAVKFNPLDSRSKDLSVHKKVSMPFKTYNDYLNACNTFRGLFKLGAGDNTTSLSSLKVVKSVYDMLDSMSFNNRCHFVEGSNSWPVPGIGKIATILFESSYFNESQNDVKLNYIKHLVI